MLTGSKNCRVCGEMKPVEAFNRSQTLPDGRQYRCRDCEAVYRDANRARRQAVERARYHAHSEDERARRIAYYHAHRSESSVYGKAYYAAHRTACLIVKRAWRESHKHQVALQKKQYRIIARERIAAWYQANKVRLKENAHLRRARQLKAKILGPVDYAEIRKRDHGICWLCKRPIANAKESFDHAVPLARGGEHSTRNVRLAHWQCNQKKHANLVTHQGFLL